MTHTMSWLAGTNPGWQRYLPLLDHSFRAITLLVFPWRFCIRFWSFSQKMMKYLQKMARKYIEMTPNSWKMTQTAHHYHINRSFFSCYYVRVIAFFFKPFFINPLEIWKINPMTQHERNDTKRARSYHYVRVIGFIFQISRGVMKKMAWKL